MVPKNSGLERCRKISKEYNFSGKYIEMRGEDIPLIVSKFIKKGKRAIGITGEDLFREFQVKNGGSGIEIIEKITWDDSQCIFGKPTLCLLGPEGKTLSDLPKELNVSINQKYKELAKRSCINILENKGYKIKKIYASGSTEELFVNGIVDLVIDMVYSGKSAKDANLDIYEKLFESDIVIIGKVVDDCKIKIPEGFVDGLNFEKVNGLMPTVVQDELGNVLILAYSSKESLSRALKTGRGWYFSRERKRLWMKGETSGNVQEIVSISKDCDGDALLFKVKQSGDACHLGRYSCFSNEKKEFTLNELYNKVKRKIEKNAEGSYTAKLVNDESLLKRKIVEEAAEVITFKDRENLIWECADLIYFLFVLMAKEGITIEDVENENLRRDKK